MKSRGLSWFMVLGLSLAAPGCPLVDDTADDGIADETGGNPTTMFVGGNNWATLQGEPVAEQGANTRNEVMVTASGDSDSFAMGPMWAIERGESFTYVAMSVTNRTDIGRCFVQFSDLDYRNAQGDPLPGLLGFTYVQGSVGLLSDGTIATDTCLAPDETGYFLDILEFPVEQVVGAEFRMEDNVDGITDPDAELIPQSYDYADGSLSVSALAGGGEGLIAGTGRTVMLDDQGQAVYWDLPVIDQTVEPGETIDYTEMLFGYAGTATAVVPFIGFEPVSATAARVPRPQVLRIEAAQADAWRRRTLRSRSTHAETRGGPSHGLSIVGPMTRIAP